MTSLPRRLLDVLRPEGIPWPVSLLYDRWSRTGLFRHHYDLVAEDVAARCPAHGGRLLDVGTGPGRLLLRIHELHPEMGLAGADISAAMVARAKANLAAAGLADRVKVVQGSASRLPFPDKSFETVVSTASMHHWKDAAAGLNDIHRVLKPGGRALIYDIVLDAPPAETVERMARAFGRWKLTLFRFRFLVEPFPRIAGLEAVVRGTRFGRARTRFVGLLCCLELDR